MNDFVVSARQIKRGVFVAEPGPSHMLVVPAGADAPLPRHGRTGDAWVKAWLQQLLEAATWGIDERTGAPRGDILVHVHGYNNSAEAVLERHRRLETDLRGIGWKGVVVSFDWPSDTRTIGYLEDRHDAKRSAMRLVTDLIALLAAKQTHECAVNTHILAHSMGAYVVREAFDDADDAQLANNCWMVSQLCLIGADVSSASLSDGHPSSDSLYRHCTRLTNYFSLGDSVLKLSNVKRSGVAPRVGRIGLPLLAPVKTADIDCTSYHQALLLDPAVQLSDQPHGFLGNPSHSWYIGNRVFTLDLFETLKGDLDRRIIATRSPIDDSRRLRLVPV
jgi:pimeloyl-ACP methyl ester carboxylesterase